MKLKFIGTGNASNLERGNNNAYFIDSNSLFLIDIGWSSFPFILNNMSKVVEYDKISIIITHMHSDHVGGLSDTILEMYFKHKKQVIIYVHEDLRKELVTYLEIQGIYGNMYQLITCKERIPKKINEGLYVKLFKTNHFIEKERLSTSLVIENKQEKETTFYSSDIRDLKNGIQTEMVNADKVYLDCSSFKVPVHNDITVYEDKFLNNFILKNVKEKYFMHLDKGMDEQEFIERSNNIGFKYVKNVNALE